jgi:hypothetical protein
VRTLKNIIGIVLLTAALVAPAHGSVERVSFLSLRAKRSNLVSCPSGVSEARLLRRAEDVAPRNDRIQTFSTLPQAEETLPASLFDRQLTSIRSEYSVYAQQVTDSAGKPASSGSVSRPKHLSPGKAFVYSLVVPGLGQYYNGSKAKAAGLFVLDVTAWVLNFKYRADGNDLTDKFEKFQQDNWKLDGYQKYLLLCYGTTDDNQITAQEVSHHLPDSPTQQYYEMTGKYDQFSWGWVDATYQGRTLDSFLIVGDTMPRITDHQFAPQSVFRDQYEIMRHEADNKFGAANRWVIVSLANHVISAFDALLSAKRRNNQGGSGEFGRVKVKAELRSFYAHRDTPYLRFSYAF